MPVALKMYASLAKFAPDNADAFPVGRDETVETLLAGLGLAPDDVTTVLVNGGPAGPDAPVGDGDRITLLPAVSGG